MKNDFVAVLDIGTNKITCMCGENVNNSASEFVIRAIGQCDYNGYDENGWFEPESLGAVIKQAVNQAENKMRSRIKSITVGVPTSFCYMSNSQSTTVFGSKKKIDLYDVNDIFTKADIFGDTIDGRLIARNAVYFIVDDGTVVQNAVGMVARKLTGLVTFSFVDKKFDKIIHKYLGECGISKVKLVNAGEVEARFVGSLYNVGGYSIVIDIGHLNTTVMLSAGKGVLFGKCFDLGSAYIAADISQVLKVSYSQSLQLLEKIDLNLEFSSDDTYMLPNGLTVGAYRSNEVAKSRIEQIAGYIKKCFEYCDRQIPNNTPIVLTGGGLAYLRGGVDWLSRYLGKDVITYTNDNPQLCRNEYTSCYALVSYAIGASSNIKDNSIASKIGRMFGRR